jgi:hypothetical protein
MQIHATEQCAHRSVAILVTIIAARYIAHKHYVFYRMLFCAVLGDGLIDFLKQFMSEVTPWS